MKAHMTNGTWEFLQRVAERNKQYQFHFMFSDTSASVLAYYESMSNVRSVFAAGRSYEVLIKSGEIEEEGFFVMNNIPLTEDGVPIFENRFVHKENHFNNIYGFIAFRLLRPVRGHTYIIFTQWASKDAYELWRESDNFTQLYDYQTIKQPAYFSSRPFVTYYSLFYEEEEEENGEEDEENKNDLETEEKEIES